MAGVVWPTTVTLKTGTGPSCAGVLDCGPGPGRVCASAALATNPPARNNAVVRLDMERVSATSGPAWADRDDDQIETLRAIRYASRLPSRRSITVFERQPSDLPRQHHTGERR